eukprot:Transcript_4946.p3 GENE.Transcript_4946~~Transcript_4946.p3  ORF type:complete len:474 (+),score=230.79 Transcript_4946:2027-3448(+)
MAERRAALRRERSAEGEGADGRLQTFARADETDQWVQLRRSRAEAPPKHVLVCAPSNAAIDEIVSRLLQLGGGVGGLLDVDGERYVPHVVRVGPNIKETLVEVSLDTLAKRRQADHEGLTYDAAKMAVLNEASIVCTTLSCAGYSMFTQLKSGFDTVLIDEAAQAIEVSTLIPLKYACRRLILVGDPSQLPATVFSEPAVQHDYEQGLFQRLQRGQQPVRMLTTQYRMHPHISLWPARRFYEGALQDAPFLLTDEARCPWHAHRCLRPYVFYDVADGYAEEASSSWLNELEAQLALCIVRCLLDRFPAQLTPASIGIIAPYNGQVRHLRRVIAEALGAERALELEVNSVDGFQGREKEVIIFSAVRSDLGRAHTRGVGFLKDPRRINVSLTRARRSLFVLGHAQTLRGEPLWATMIKDAEERQCVIKAHSPVGIWFETASKEIALPPATSGAKHSASPRAGAPQVKKRRGKAR